MFIFLLTISLSFVVNRSIAFIIASESQRSNNNNNDIIPGQYIVKLRDDINCKNFIRHNCLNDINGKCVTISARVSLIYSRVINGFSAKLDARQIKYLNFMPEVELVSNDHVVKGFDTTTTTVTQSESNWNLARISRRTKLPNGNASTPIYKYKYDKSGGRGTTVYVLDTGVHLEHEEFEGRAVLGATFVDDESSDDGHGHGTHVAAIIGGKTFGVAKKVTIVSVKILNRLGLGTETAILGGIEWAINNATSFLMPSSGSIINMSLGRGFDRLRNLAVRNAVSQQITVVAAAGNDGKDACQISPASEPSAITVAASDVNDTIASFSSRGPCVDIIAPGKNVKSAWTGSPIATMRQSGTSMAAPHVTGVAAILMAKEGVRDPLDVWRSIERLALKGIIENISPGTVNLFLQSDVSS